MMLERSGDYKPLWKSLDPLPKNTTTKRSTRANALSSLEVAENNPSLAHNQYMNNNQSRVPFPIPCSLFPATPAYPHPPSTLSRLFSDPPLHVSNIE
jgi:hypothetical protein